jgi:HEPN domain-containing protein
MPEPERVIEVAGEWVIKAEHDLTTAVHTLKLGADCPTDTVCFHAQQCVEKYLKALLVVAGMDFPKTHDTEALLALLPIKARPMIAYDDQARLTLYAIASRYPGAPDISYAEARAAVALARQVRAEVRRRLPAKVKRRMA